MSTAATTANPAEQQPKAYTPAAVEPEAIPGLVAELMASVGRLMRRG